MPDNQLLGVELARVGTWDLAVGGRRSFTAEDFADAIAASVDPDYGIMPIRPGHTDPRFDGEPALGRVINLRMSGDRLIGDLVSLPQWLTQRIHAAYPERSVEGYTNVTSPTGRKYRLVLTALALLGVAPPAMKGLADLPAAVAAGAELIAASSAVMDLADAPAEDDDSLDAVRRAVAQFASLGESERPAGETVIVPGDEPQPSEGSLMDPTVIRTALGLAADATDEQVTEALSAQATALTAAQEQATAAQAAAEQAAARITELETVAAAANTGTPPAGFSLIADAVLEEMRTGIAQGIAASESIAKQQEDAFIAANRNRIGAASNPQAALAEETLRTKWRANPADAKGIAASLPVVIHTAPAGHDGGSDDASTDDVFLAGLFGDSKGA